MNKQQVIALFLASVNCQSGSDLLYMETQSTNVAGEKEFTIPEAPKGQAVGEMQDGPAIYGEATYTSAPAQEDKYFASADGPSFSSAPVSAAMSEPELYEYDYPVEEWEESPMEDYMRGPVDMDMDKNWDIDMPLMDDIDWEEYEIMPIMEEANWEMPEDLTWDELSDPEFYQEQAQEWNEDKDWSALTDPEFYQDQAAEWGYDSIIAESGMPMDFNNTSDIVSWDQEQMREEFRDAFGWAIMGDVWDSRESSTCADRCNEEYDMCCVQVTMQDMNSQAVNYESYCMYQDSIMDDYSMEMMGYELEMKCDKDSYPMEEDNGMWDEVWADSAIRVASGIISAAVVFSSVC